MAFSAGTRTVPPLWNPNESEHRRQIASWVIQAHQGKISNTGTVTLTANAQSTTVADARAGIVSFVGFMPLTLNAASEVAAGTMFVSTQGNEFFVITHASAASADRNFRYALLG